MATQRLTYPSAVILPVEACGCVVLCLDDSWAIKVTSGIPLIIATLANNTRYLGGPMGRLFGKVNSRRQDVIQYGLEVNDSQFENNPETGLPWVLGCEDIVEISPYCCLTTKILEAIPEEGPV